MPSLARKVRSPTTSEGAEIRPAEPAIQWPVELDLERLVWDPEYREEMRVQLYPRS